jgi:hypothetical protein
MIWTRLYDPARTPSHWTEIVGKDQYVVFVSDARSGAPRDADGRPFLAVGGSDGHCAALCQNVDEARDFAREVVARRPELCCEIYTREGKSNPPLEVIYDPSVRDRYVGVVHARRLALTGAGLATVGTGFVVLDFRRDLLWIWGYVIGLKCLIIATVLLTRSFTEWLQFRRETNH